MGNCSWAKVRAAGKSSPARAVLGKSSASRGRPGGPPHHSQAQRAPRQPTSRGRLAKGARHKLPNGRRIGLERSGQGPIWRLKKKMCKGFCGDYSGEARVSKVVVLRESGDDL